MALAREPFKLTYADYELLPPEKRVELIEGDFFVSPSVNTKHQRILRELGGLLNEWIKTHQLGEIFYAPYDVVLSNHNVVQPDLLFVARKHSAIVGEKNCQGPPDLAIEILSPSNEKHDLVVKRNLYSKFGVREYWIVDPQSETITLLAFGENKLKEKQTYPKGSVLESLVVEGFKLRTADIF